MFRVFRAWGAGLGLGFRASRRNGTVLSMIEKDPNYGNYGIFLIMGNAGFRSSTVVL